MKKLSFLLAAVLFVTKSYSQTITKQEKGYFNLTEITAFSGNNQYEYQVTPNKFDGSTDGAYAFSLRNINGYFITNKIAIGLGVGLENYTHADSYFNNNNLFLMFLDARYYFKNSANTFFAYGDIGSSIKIADHFDKGPMYNLGVGYKFKVGKNTALTTGLGYADQSIKHDNSNITKDRYYGFALKAGVLF
jgi:hypothetical protein